MIGHRISAIRSNVKGPFRFWIGLEGSPSTLACHSAFHWGVSCQMLQPRAGLGLDGQETREGFINPQSIIRFLLLSPHHPYSPSCPLLRPKRTRTSTPTTHTKWPHTPPPTYSYFPPGITVHILLSSTSTTVTRHLSHPRINITDLTFRTSSRPRAASFDHLRRSIPGLATPPTSISGVAIQKPRLIPHSTDRSSTQRATTFILRMAISPPSIHPTTKLVLLRPRFGQFG